MPDDQPAAGGERPIQAAHNCTNRLVVEVDQHVATQNDILHTCAVHHSRILILNQVQPREQHLTTNVRTNPPARAFDTFKVTITHCRVCLAKRPCAVHSRARPLQESRIDIGCQDGDLPVIEIGKRIAQQDRQ
jgi:hypothetical protein